MKTLLVRGLGTVPSRVKEIVRAGSTEMKEVRADEERDATTLEADRVVVWNEGEIEIRSTAERRENVARLKWPQDEDKLRMFFQTGG
jgi:hypothetical protein